MTAPSLTHALTSDTHALAEELERILVTVKSATGGGSGTSWSEDGLVITNHHVVPGENATVVLGDGSEHRAAVEARDAANDLALLRVDARLHPATPGDSAGVRPGHLAFAIGNPWGQRGTLTAGAIFSRGAATAENGGHLQDVIRADLRLAPGNSGGPMTDALGRVIGINSMIAGGMAIAIPVATVLNFVERSLNSKPGVLGITFQPVRVPHAVAASYDVDDAAALMLTAVEPGSAAERAGLYPGDIVLRAGSGRRGLRHLAGRLRDVRAGQPFPLELLRGGQLLDVTATPAARTTPFD
jgi:serine protease Do